MPRKKATRFFHWPINVAALKRYIQSQWNETISRLQRWISFRLGSWAVGPGFFIARLWRFSCHLIQVRITPAPLLCSETFRLC